MLSGPPARRRACRARERKTLRYGLVREIDGQAPIAAQRQRLETAGLDILLEEGPPTRVALRAQSGLFSNLKAGDELLVCGLDVLQMSTGQLVLLFRQFDEAGVVLKIVGEGGGVIAPGSSRQARTLLALLAANEVQRPDPQRASARNRPGAKLLNRFQLKHANALRRSGASLRMISRLFEISPADLRLALGKPVAPPKPAAVVVPLPERRPSAKAGEPRPRPPRALRRGSS